jgi:CDP-glycerol glycerophosphotransferase (TagB/SpsB family)
MKTIVRRPLILSAKPIWWLLSRVIPKRDDYIAVNSFPDFDDTVRSIGYEASQSGKIVIVLTFEKRTKWPDCFKELNIKVAHRYSLRGLWLYHRSKYIFFTHGLFSFWKPGARQHVINIWHGMPIKNIGLLDGTNKRDIEQFNFTIAYNQRFQHIIANAFGVSKDKVLISAHPRIDGMLVDPRTERLHLPAHKFLTIWLPTYRQSVYGAVRVDGNIIKDIFNVNSDLSLVDAALRQNECVCLVKPHPMAKVNKDMFARYSNLVYIDENTISDLGITLYQLLGQSDFLITDISSVYFDYKYTNRPIIIYCPDLYEYKESRGFVAPIDTLIEEEIIIDESRFVEQLNKLFAILHVRKSEVKSFDFSGGITKSLLKMIGAV